MNGGYNKDFGLSKLPKRYEKIDQIIDNYELPAEGRLERNDKTTGKDLYHQEYITYKNGYTFSKNSKKFVSRVTKGEHKHTVPTKGQYLGIMLGIVSKLIG
ncbi:hypothetical protein [Halobacillus sp. BBL2006]|uniref:hypothetical protein n=1 Tax=Halobacillus sp. BBL2006 TaxID=1543706 RepID=UPI000AFA66A6|nr:hypothetical protein [Halobacillus sp. BBL2006]